MNKTPKSKIAQVTLKYAVDSGKVVKSTTCEKCGKEPKTMHGHHEDYDKPLEVIWLCPPCHAFVHGRGPRGPKEKPGKNPRPLMDPKTPSALSFRKERLKLFVTHQEAADAIGVTRAAIGHWERGIRSVPETVWILLECIKNKKAQG